MLIPADGGADLAARAPMAKNVKRLPERQITTQSTRTPGCPAPSLSHNNTHSQFVWSLYEEGMTKSNGTTSYIISGPL